MSEQLETTEAIKETALNITGEGIEYLQNAIGFINTKIKHKEYNKETENHEKSIRWKRTADQILKDGYVYKEKGCTDMVILFQALCKAKGYSTMFVKVKEINGNAIHSVAEVELPKLGWHIVDVVGRAGVKKGKLEIKNTFGRWTFWKRGHDAWELGFTSYNSKFK